jgi:hypothetical protein
MKFEHIIYTSITIVVITEIEDRIKLILLFTTYYAELMIKMPVKQASIAGKNLIDLYPRTDILVIHWISFCVFALDDSFASAIDSLTVLKQ